MATTTNTGIRSMLREAFSIIGRYRQAFLIAALLSRVLSAGSQRYLSQQIDISQLQTDLNDIAFSVMPTPEEAAVTPPSSESVFEMYGAMRDHVKPYSKTFLLRGLLMGLVSMMIFMYIAYTVFDDHEGKQRSLADKASQGVSQFLPYLGTVILESILLLILFALFIIPGIIAAVFRLFTQMVSLDQKIYGRSAIKESFHLVKGRWRKTLGVLLIFTIIFGLLFGILVGLITGLLIEAGVSMDWINALSGILTALLTIFLQTIFLVVYLRRKTNRKDAVVTPDITETTAA